MDLLKAGASIIKNNGDDATKGLDIDDIANALNKLVGNGQGGIDLVKFCNNIFKWNDLPIFYFYYDKI